MDVTSCMRLSATSRCVQTLHPCAPPTTSLAQASGNNDGGSVPANHAPTAASRYSNTDRPCPPGGLGCIVGFAHVPCLPIRCDARLATGSSRDLAFLPPYLLGNPNHAPHPSPAIRRCNDLKANPASHEGGRERDEWDVSSLSLTAVRAETGSRRSVNREGITRE